MYCQLNLSVALSNCPSLSSTPKLHPPARNSSQPSYSPHQPFTIQYSGISFHLNHSPPLQCRTPHFHHRRFPPPQTPPLNPYQLPPLPPRKPKTQHRPAPQATMPLLRHNHLQICHGAATHPFFRPKQLHLLRVFSTPRAREMQPFFSRLYRQACRRI